MNEASRVGPTGTRRRARHEPAEPRALLKQNQRRTQALRRAASTLQAPAPAKAK